MFSLQFAYLCNDSNDLHLILARVFNEEAENITAKPGVGDRVRILCDKQAFLTVKDHNDDFPNDPDGLINPTKTK